MEYKNASGHLMRTLYPGMLTDRGRKQIQVLGQFLAMKHAAMFNDSVDPANAPSIADQHINPRVNSI